MRILAIETSCDETGVAIVENGHRLIANKIASQVKWHKKYGGVVPEMAARMHAEKIHVLINEVFEDSKLTWNDIDACAVTYGPGLEGALLIGISTAKTISGLLKIPLIAVNHLHGHIYANFLLEKKPKFPFITLIASGGHTILVLVRDYFEFEVLGNTRDDACGEAFDKVARVLGLSYPGGPEIEKHAQNGKENAFSFPRAMKGKGLDFSFSGLKTAVIQKVNSINTEKKGLPIAHICASFQKCVIDILISKAFSACLELNINQLVLSGGVAANKTLIKAFIDEGKQQSIKIFIPPKEFCTDNAAMIGIAAFYKYQKFSDKISDIKVRPNLSIMEK